MPNYCYERPDGEIFERAYPMGEAPDFLVDAGQTCIRSFQAEITTQSVSVKGGSGHVRRTWPMTCYGSGVNADQAPELRKHLKDAGVPTEVTRNGDPVYTSAAHRRKALKARGLVDKNSFN